VLACAAGGLTLSGRQTETRLEQLKRITTEQVDGMNKEEVVRRIGPPDVLTAYGEEIYEYWYWLDGEQKLLVSFDDEGKACQAIRCSCGGPRRPPTLMEKIRHSLGL
jgi:hypothetical protein